MIKPILTDRSRLTIVSDLIRDPEDAVHAGHVINNLRDTAATLNNCAGLAAPQIGHTVRIILIKVQSKAIIMINPEIIESKGKMISGAEGCFSVPGSITKPIRVRRRNKIRVQWDDVFGCTNFARFKSFEARLIQHEIDHLDGILIGDKK